MDPEAGVAIILWVFSLIWQALLIWDVREAAGYCLADPEREVYDPLPFTIGVGYAVMAATLISLEALDPLGMATLNPNAPLALLVIFSPWIIGTVLSDVVTRIIARRFFPRVRLAPAFYMI